MSAACEMDPKDFSDPNDIKSQKVFSQALADKLHTQADNKSRRDGDKSSKYLLEPSPPNFD